MKARVVFMGTPSFAVPILDALLRSGYEVVAVYTQPDRVAGRGRQIFLTPVKRLALEHEIPVIQPDTLKSGETLRELADFRPELIVVAAFGQILPQEMLSLPSFDCLNVHPSLLPRHRGSSPVAASILCGDERTGVSIMLMDAGLDSGPILAQQEVAIASKDDTGLLTSRLAQVGVELLLGTLPAWLEAKIEPQAQDEGKASYSRLIRSEDGEMDWQLSAVELWRRTRAYNPWPGCYTWWQGRRLRVREAVPLKETAEGQVGTVVPLPPPISAGVITGQKLLGLCQVQLEGKRQMGAGDFVRGQRAFIGSILG